MGSSLGTLFAVDMGLQWALWAIASVLRTEKFYDLAGSSTFGLLLAMSYPRAHASVRQQVQTAMVATWAARLGVFLFTRVMKQGSDSRFDKAKNSPGQFFVYWSLQGVWVMLTLMPTLLLNRSRFNPALNIRDYIGWGLWAAGFLLEAVADDQKRRFRNDSANRHRFIHHGVWAWSRHPNYLGEIMLWSGLCASASSVFRGYEWISVASPVFVSWLLIRISGIPILERQAQKRWGGNAEFVRYRERTAMLIPGIW